MRDNPVKKALRKFGTRKGRYVSKLRKRWERLSYRQQRLIILYLLGLFAAVIFGCAISCDDTYVHAWGSIFIQDVVLPIRKRPFKTPGNHLLALRLSIVGVALFGFIFSILFPMKGYIFMFFALTGAIYLGGAGAVIIGGLYWKRGTTAAAWCRSIPN